MAYQPASNLTTTGTIAHLATVWYQRTGLDQLMKKFRFLRGTEPDVIPLRNGKLIQWFRYTLFGSNTTASSEGTVGTGLALTSTTVTATVSEYSDFITVSSLLQDTAIDRIVENASAQLGYRAGLSVDTIVRTEFDANAGAELNTLGAAFTAGDIRRSVALLRGIDVLPKEGDEFIGIFHPYSIYDLQSDNTAGGFIDVTKYADPKALVNGEVGKVGGTRVLSSTNVKTSGTAPDVLYFNYIIGRGAVGVVDLAGSGPTKVEDPSKESFKINVIRGGPSIADPEGMIGSAVSYRYVFVAKTLDTTNLRYRMVKANASLV